MNRVRHVGILGCFEGDKYCCGADYCPNATITQSVPGCSVGEEIYWRDATNFCPWPPWYNTNIEQCGNSLANAADVTWCYTYGCNYESAPTRYVLNRAWVVNALFLVWSIFRIVGVKLTNVWEYRLIPKED